MAEKIIHAVQLLLHAAKYVLLPCAIITFSPDSWLDHMRLLEFKNAYGGWVAILFLVCLSIVMNNLWSKIREKRKLKEIFTCLNPTEKEILKDLYEQDHMFLPVNRAPAMKLINLKLIKAASGYGRDGRDDEGLTTEASCTLTLKAAKFLKDRPQYFSEKKETVTQGASA